MQTVIETMAAQYPPDFDTLCAPSLFLQPLLQRHRQLHAAGAAADDGAAHNALPAAACRAAAAVSRAAAAARRAAAWRCCCCAATATACQAATAAAGPVGGARLVHPMQQRLKALDKSGGGWQWIVMQECVRTRRK